MDLSADIQAALTAAHRAARTVRGTTSPNPPVGAAIVDPSGDIIGIGATEPAGGAHAEILALRHAGDRARGATAVVTLEPCNHTGRTGPCTKALIGSGIKAVYYVHADPNPVASGGAQTLRAAGVEVNHIGSGADNSVSNGIEAGDELEPWLRATALNRVHVTAKFAQSLDGFSAAVDGTSQWITGELARARVHRDRAWRDAIIIGSATALMDNPSLTARYQGADGATELYEAQPRRVVIGGSDLTQCDNLQRLGFEQYDTIDKALQQLWITGARDVLVEGGPKLVSSFFHAGLVDEIQAYIAPVILGDGRSVLAEALGTSLSDALRFHLVSTEVLGDDVLMTLRR